MTTGKIPTAERMAALEQITALEKLLAEREKDGQDVETLRLGLDLLRRDYGGAEIDLED